MSHFTVLVIGEDDIESALAPFNEQPKEDDDAVELVFEDKTDEARKQYETETTECIRMPGGDLKSRYDSMFEYKGGLSDERDYLGGVPVTVPFTELYPSFEAYMREYAGYEPHEVDGQVRYGYYHNPKAKWDWYQIGGRWAGFFTPKEGADGTRGSNGVMDSCNSDDGIDDCTKDDVDFEAMRNEAGKRAAAEWDRIHALIAGLPKAVPWADFLKRVHSKEITIDEARKQYNAQPAVKAVARELSFYSKVEDYQISREQFIQDARDSAIVPFAVLYKGEWMQKGEMGWFGRSTDEMTEQEWARKVNELIDSLPGDTRLTLVDCHI